MSEGTRILGPVAHGDPKAAEQFLPLVYEELGRLDGGVFATGVSEDDNFASPLWDTTEDENPLSRRPVVVRPYIFPGAYWYESGCFRGNRGEQRPLQPAHTAVAPP